MARRLLTLEADSILAPELLTSSLCVCARAIFHTGTDTQPAFCRAISLIEMPAGEDSNMESSAMFNHRLYSLFEFMNEDRGHQFFHLKNASAAICSILQCFTTQGFLHSAVSDKFKRRVTWHRAKPIDLTVSWWRDEMLLVSGLAFVQRIDAAPEIKQCINFCRQHAWCPSSAASCQQQRSESCYMSALLLHSVCSSHPLFTFCGVIADAVPRLLSWLQRPILLTCSPSNSKKTVTTQPQSLDTWQFPAVPLEFHTLVCLRPFDYCLFLT
jgi:hypothetical protein